MSDCPIRLQALPRIPASRNPLPGLKLARLFRLARGRHTLRGWLRYRLALLFAPQPVYRAFVLQARRRYRSLTERR